MIEIFKAKSVITVNPSLPRAEAVAVRDGLILEAGTLETLQPWLVNNEYSINEQFKDSIIVPGLIDKVAADENLLLHRVGGLYVDALF